MLVSATAVAIVSSCSVQGLNFVEDTRVRIQSPAPGETVTVPFEVRWDADTSGGQVAVLVDRTPPPPGKSVAWLFRGDDACSAADDCPDDEYLAEHGVFVTSSTAVTVDRVSAQWSEDRNAERHEVTIVVLDDNGGRSGEGAFHVDFEVDDGDAT